MDLALIERLAPCRRVLLVGAGGGFDIVSAVPLYCWLRSQGKQAFLASLSFSRLRGHGGGIVEVTPFTQGDPDYFPERFLSEWFAQHSEHTPIFSFKAAGALRLSELYGELIERLQADALVLVDGGTDSLMRGDEPQLGTPEEDMASIGAAYLTNLPVKLLVCLGFGVDVFHGVSHHYVLKAVAELGEGFLGAFSLLPGMPEFLALCSAHQHLSARMPDYVSIVCSSIVAAGLGRFGDHHSTPRTQGSKLFINPLMAMYWSFELDAVARRCLYLQELLTTYTRQDVERVIGSLRERITPEPWREIPL